MENVFSLLLLKPGTTETIGGKANEFRVRPRIPIRRMIHRRADLLNTLCVASGYGSQVGRVEEENTVDTTGGMWGGERGRIMSGHAKGELEDILSSTSPLIANNNTFRPRIIYNFYLLNLMNTTVGGKTYGILGARYIYLVFVFELNIQFSCLNSEP